MPPSHNVYSVFTDFSFLPQRLAEAEITPTALPLLFSDGRLVYLHMSLSPDKCKRLGCRSTAEQLLSSYQVLGSVPNTDPSQRVNNQSEVFCSGPKNDAICFQPVCWVVFLPVCMCESRKQSFLFDL